MQGWFFFIIEKSGVHVVLMFLNIQTYHLQPAEPTNFQFNGVQDAWPLSTSKLNTQETPMYMGI